MKKKICRHEAEVIDNMRAASLTPEIQAHVSECPLCKETVSVYEWMNRFKSIAWETEAAPKNLPTPESIWKRAYPLYKPYKDLVKKALRPLIFSRLLAYGITTVGVILLLLFNKQEISHFMESYIRFDMTLPLILAFIVPLIFVCISISFCILVNAFEKRKRDQLSL